MRQTLTNYAVARRRKKRGGTDPIERALEFYDQRKIDVTDLDAALRDLETLDPRQGQIVELRFFGGLTVAEIASGDGNFTSDGQARVGDREDVAPPRIVFQQINIVPLLLRNTL